MNTSTNTRTFRQRLADVIEQGEVDPRKAAEKVRPDVTDDEIDALVMAALVEAASQLIRSVRRPVDNPASSPSRYGALRDVSSDPTSWPVCPSGRENGWKRLGECTVADLEQLAAGYETKAAKMTSIAARYRTLADTLRASGKRTVDELPADALHGLAKA